MSLGLIPLDLLSRDRRKQRLKEEKTLTKYSSDDLDGWEFKIVRSATGAFRKTEKIQELCSQEAQSGWEMIEKFDNSRIRFKRKIQMRSQNSISKIDPYRTTFGIGQNQFQMLSLGIMIFVAGILILLLI